MLTKLHKDALLENNIAKLKLEHLLAIKLYKTKEVEGSDCLYHSKKKELELKLILHNKKHESL